MRPNRYGFVHDRPRNRLSGTKADKLVFMFSNRCGVALIFGLKARAQAVDYQHAGVPRLEPEDEGFVSEEDE
jgi:hypothetical protein